MLARHDSNNPLNRKFPIPTCASSRQRQSRSAWRFGQSRNDKHKDTKTQRLKERPLQRCFIAAFLCAFVSWCLCVYPEMMTMRLFGTDGIRARAGEFPLNSTAIVAIGRAVGEKLGGKI